MPHTGSEGGDPRVLLSIAIPTHNGAGTIRETLDSIVSQLEDGVEVVISDNASTDYLRQAAAAYAKRFPGIRYCRNETKLHADESFCAAVERAQGRYVWLLADDDRLSSGAVSRVMQVLIQHDDLAAVFVNWGSYSEDFSACIAQHVLPEEPDCWCQDADSFLSRVRLNPALVSSNIVRRELWQTTDLSQFLGGNWVHFAALCRILQRGSSYVVSTPCVQYRTGAAWKEDEARQMELGLRLAALVNSLPHLGYRRKTSRILLRTIVRSTPRSIVRMRAQGAPVTWTLVKHLWRQLRRAPSFWMLDLPLLLLPVWSHRSVLKWGRKLRQSRRMVARRATE